jgi:hypothetical protein
MTVVGGLCVSTLDLEPTMSTCIVHHRGAFTCGSRSSAAQPRSMRQYGSSVKYLQYSVAVSATHSRSGRFCCANKRKEIYSRHATCYDSVHTITIVHYLVWFQRM